MEDRDTGSRSLDRRVENLESTTRVFLMLYGLLFCVNCIWMLFRDV